MRIGEAMMSPREIFLVMSGNDDSVARPDISIADDRTGAEQSDNVIMF